MFKIRLYEEGHNNLLATTTLIEAWEVKVLIAGEKYIREKLTQPLHRGQLLSFDFPIAYMLFLPEFAEFTTKSTLLNVRYDDFDTVLHEEESLHESIQLMIGDRVWIDGVEAPLFTENNLFLIKKARK